MPHHIDSIILVTVSRWDQDYSSASISLAKELSKETKVFFVDNPFTVKDVLAGWRTPQIRRRVKALLFGKAIYRTIEPGNENWIAVTPLVVVPINWLPRGSVFNFFSKLNNSIFNRTLKRIVKENDLKKYIYFNSYNPFYGYKLPAEIKPVVNIYQSRDNIKESEYVNKHGPGLEMLASKAADIRLATSTDLVNQLSASIAPFKFFPNAADVDLFGKAFEEGVTAHTSLLNIKTPVIGYMGNICLRIDYDLLYKVATHFNTCTILLVGPRNDTGQHNFNFEMLKNVVFVGAKKIHELPSYLVAMTCAILPFKKNALTRSIYPLKINEYLAAGKPVVTTSFSPDIASFRDLVYMAVTDEDFVKNIELALAETNPGLRKKRHEEATKNSWKIRVSQFWQEVESFKSA